METSDEDIPGYESIVHPGPLKPVLFWRAPQEYVLLNILFSMFVALMLSWRWLIVGALVHGTLAWLWWYDQHLLPILIRSWRYKRFYRAN